MKTIGEMLVETTARLRGSAVAVTDGNGNWQAMPAWPMSDAMAEAREIVAEFYGSPCAKPGVFFDGVVLCGPVANLSVAQSQERPSDICRLCGWPRGEHGRTK